jgi:hypothetical protein
MLYCQPQQCEQLQSLLSAYGMEVLTTAEGEDIPGSFWGDAEAGIIGNRLYVTTATPVHSALHEACHYICMDGERRSGLHTDAGGGYDEENGVCYLQLLLSDHIPAYSRFLQFTEMDEWGYSFRLGSAQAWFENDADDALKWLQDYGILDEERNLSWRTRDDQRERSPQ